MWCRTTLIILFILGLAAPGFSATEWLQVSATHGTINGWTLAAGASKIAAVTGGGASESHDDDTSYIHSTPSISTQQQFTVTDTSAAIEAGATINVVSLRSRCQRFSQNTSYTVTVVLPGGTATASNSVGNTWATAINDFTSKPPSGPWTKADVDALEIRLHNNQSRQVNCTTYEVMVDYTNPVPPPTGATLLAHWRFDEGVGDTTADASGNGHTATRCASGTCPSASGPAWIGGRLNGALDFDGSTQYLTFTIPSPTYLSICAWVWNDTIPDVGIDREVVSTFEDRWAFRTFANGGGPAFIVFVDGTHYAVQWGTTLSTGLWYHLCGTYDGETMQLYVDGGAPETSNPDPSGVLVAVSGVGYIGVHASVAREWFDGKIDEVYIYDGAISQEQVDVLYQAGFARRRGMISYSD